MSEFPYRTVQTARLRHRVAEEGTGTPVILLHGFPEGAYSWRKQLPALAAAGFRAIAPDQRGYAGTDAPPEIATYDHIELALDIVALMDARAKAPKRPLVIRMWLTLSTRRARSMPLTMLPD